MDQPHAALTFPHPEPPPPGGTKEVAPGILWLRLPLPFLLDHVNVYLLREEDGWTLIDTGLGDDATRAIWERVLSGPLEGRPIVRVLATHLHPDHAGLVGWLTRRFDAPLLMSRTDFLVSLAFQNQAFAENRPYFRERGLDEPAVERMVTLGLGYLKRTTGLPPQYLRLRAGDTLTLGGRRFDVLTGGGHAPEQIILHAPEAGLFFAADQVLARISPNVAVQSLEPRSDPLGEYLASLQAVGAAIPPDVLVLPGHDVPFIGLHARLGQLAAHHAARLDLLREACRTRALTPMEVVPVLFRRALDPHTTSFAFGEAMAHVNWLLHRGELREERGADGFLRYRTV
jgi:glyoxylase-like metal-dependent hydrolase (beta-lactamase superfamily II)